MSAEAMKPTENPVCTSDFDLPTPPWGNEWADPGEPHPDEPGYAEFVLPAEYPTSAPIGPEPEPTATPEPTED
jgi:hypothetical protein